MEYLGESEPLGALARRSAPPVEKGIGMLQESNVEPLVELPDQRLTRRVSIVSHFLQTITPAPSLAIASTSFDGPGTGLAGFLMSGAPPDTTLAVVRITSSHGQFLNTQFLTNPAPS